jgi:hypothetical protein
MNPNHFLSAAVAYLYRNRDWRPDVAVGKTLVSTSMLDRVAAELGRKLLEVPVGFKWFVDGLVDGTLGFGGEESAGASFLRRDGTVWTTDKDGLIACLLAAELTAGDGHDPAAAYDADGEVRRAGLSPHRRPGDARAEGDPLEAVTDQIQASSARRRADHGRPDPGPRQRRPDRRSQGDHRARLVRGPPVRDGGRLQGLRRELPGRGSPGADHRGGPGGRRRGKPAAAELIWPPGSPGAVRVRHRTWRVGARAVRGHTGRCGQATPAMRPESQSGLNPKVLTG